MWTPNPWLISISWTNIGIKNKESLHHSPWKDSVSSLPLFYKSHMCMTECMAVRTSMLDGLTLNIFNLLLHNEFQHKHILTKHNHRSFRKRIKSCPNPKIRSLKYLKQNPERKFIAGVFSLQDFLWGKKKREKEIPTPLFALNRNWKKKNKYRLVKILTCSFFSIDLINRQSLYNFF